MKIIALILIQNLLNGCISARVDIIPNQTFSISDEEGNPISSAKLNFNIIDNYEYKLIEQITLEADSHGFISLPHRSKKVIQVLLPHQVEAYYWHWCIEAKGYEPQYKNKLRNFSDVVEEVTLYRTSKNYNCETTDYYYEFSFKRDLQ